MHSTSMLAVLSRVSIIVVLGGCEPQNPNADTSTSTSSDSGSTDTEAGTDTTDDPGVCFDIDSPGEPQFDFCGLPSPCPDVEWELVSNCNPTLIYDPAAAACVVDSLLAGEAGAHWMGDCPGAQLSSRYVLLAYGDGTVMWYQTDINDQHVTGRATWRLIPDQAYFDGCDLGTPEGLVECFFGIAETECQLGQPTCPG